MAFFGFHGVHAEEQKNGQPFVVDLTLATDLSEAAATDRLEHTIDYSRVHALCRHIVEGERHQLIEALAGRLLTGLLAEFPRVERATVVVKKPRVALAGPLDYAAVELTRSRA